jgi:predicted ATPase/DNA-binding CsgD family transcriptional regulator
MLEVKFVNTSTIAPLNLPAQTMPFLGRQAELRQIGALLDDPDCRLLTLIGPGGIGKTRLALEVASASASNYADGVHFVSLQALPAPDLLVSTIAEVVKFPFFFGNAPAEQLFTYLESKSMLLVLDNFEHLLDGAVQISDLLARAPGVKILATSRERLNLREEWLFEVEGLRFPTENNLNGETTYSAVELFAQSARRVRPSFSLEEEASAVARICALVGGMPLALELASSWVRALSCAEIADEIQRGLDILETNARNVPTRHRDMRAVLDHSWKLLTEDERDIMMKLSVFQGGFTRDAGHEVAGASARVLSALVDKSWLHWRAEVGRYDIHELLRQYAQGKLEDCGEAETVRNIHTRSFAAFMGRQEEGIKFGRQVEALTEIERDFENVRAAWKWAARTRDTDSLNRMAESLNFFGDMKARWAEAAELFSLAEATFARPGTPTEAFTRARMTARRIRMVALGMMVDIAGLPALVEEIDASLKVAREYGHRPEIAFQVSVKGMLTKETAEAVACFEEAFILFCEANDRLYMADILVWLDVMKHNLQSTRGFLEHALELQRSIGDQNGMGWTLIHLSRSSYYERDYGAMQRYIEEASANQRARGDKKGLYWSVIMSAQWGMAMGEFDRGLELSESAMEIASHLNLPAIRQSAQAILGLMLIVTERNYELGARMCAEAVDLHIPDSFSIGDVVMDAEQGLVIAAYHAGDIEAARQHYNTLIDHLCSLDYDYDFHFYLLAPVFTLLLTGYGQYERAVEMLSAVFHLPQVPGSPQTGWLHKAPLIARVQQQLRQELGNAAYEAAWERGKLMDTDAVVDDLLDHFEPFATTAQPSETVPPSTQPILNMLTERELEVLNLLADGLSNREIAEQLFLAVGTVKWYISEIYSKLGVTSRTQAVAQGRALGLLA